MAVSQDIRVAIQLDLDLGSGRYLRKEVEMLWVVVRFFVGELHGLGSRGDVNNDGNVDIERKGILRCWQLHQHLDACWAGEWILAHLFCTLEGVVRQRR